MGETYTLEEARGFITGYIVSYDTLDPHNRREAMVEFIHHEISYEAISGLGFTISYSFTVSAITTVGQGISSPPITVYGNQFTMHDMI